MPESKAVQIALAYAAYENDTVRLLERNLAGFTRVVASRQGLFAVNEWEWLHVAHGFFFGITMRGEDLFVFEACDLPRGPTHHGRLVKLVIRDQTIVSTEVPPIRK